MHENWLEHASSTHELQSALTDWVPGGPPLQLGPLKGKAEFPEPLLLLLHATTLATTSPAAAAAHPNFVMLILLFGPTIPAIGAQSQLLASRLPWRAFRGNTA
jgi:hypothetical protein